MKALLDLTNTEKGRLLHDLFPEEMPLFLDHLQKVCADFQVDKEKYRKNWDSTSFVQFEWWFNLSQETAGLLKRHIFTMKKNSRVFSDQLFFNYTALFVNDRIIKYAESNSDNIKFKLAVDLIFKP